MNGKEAVAWQFNLTASNGIPSDDGRLHSPDQSFAALGLDLFKHGKGSLG